MMATQPMPCSASSRQSRIRRSMIALTKGQWLQMNMTSSPLGPRQLARVCRLPSVPGRSKSTAGRPKSQTGGFSATMYFSLQKRISPIIAPMNLPRFYCREALSQGAHVELPEPVARHAVRVLRLPPGASIILFEGRGGQYPARIERIERDRVFAELGAWEQIERESRLSITLVQALQSGDKMDFTIQKAVELGVRDVVPVESRRSVLRLSGERAAKRVAHWQGVVAAACEQCGRNQVPLVAPLEKLENWLARPAGGALRLMLAPDAGQTLADIPPVGEVQLLIGAEGGLDPQEMIAAQQAGFQAVRLGPRVLRTETAGLAAMAALQALWGDFREG